MRPACLISMCNCEGVKASVVVVAVAVAASESMSQRRTPPRRVGTEYSSVVYFGLVPEPKLTSICGKDKKQGWHERAPGQEHEHGHGPHAIFYLNLKCFRASPRP